MDNGSNTAQNTRKAGGKPFEKGDPRINRKGRPKSFDALRELAQQIAHEVAKTGEGEHKTPVVIDGHQVTIAEAILRTWATSKNPQLVKAFIEIAFGKVPDQVDITSKGEKLLNILEVKAIDYRVAIADLAPGSVGNSKSPGEGESALDGPAVG